MTEDRSRTKETHPNPNPTDNQPTKEPINLQGTGPRPVPSGPNSVPEPPGPTRHRPPTPTTTERNPKNEDPSHRSRRYYQPAKPGSPNNQRSTHEHPARRTPACEHGHKPTQPHTRTAHPATRKTDHKDAPPLPGQAANRSLERR